MRSWRGIVSFTHLAREARMTVTIGRRELLAALGGAVAAWPLAARGRTLLELYFRWFRCFSRLVSGGHRPAFVQGLQDGVDVVISAGGKDLDLPPDAGRRAGQACHARFIAPFPAASCLRS